MNSRARAIVKLASTKTSVPQLRSWLFEDEHGRWEKEAEKTLERVEQRVQELGLTDVQPEDVHEEIACYLAYLGAKVLVERKAKNR